MNTLSEYKIPKNDYEAWEHYPRYNWMYVTTRLLDAQRIKWSPFRTELYSESVPVFTLHSEVTHLLDGEVFIEPDHGRHVFSEALIRKGELKWLAHFDNGKFEEDINGEVELRVSAFVTLYFKKFNGIVAFETIGNHILAVKLHPTTNMLEHYPEHIVTQIRKIYPKVDTL